jgi:transcription elongation factor GreA
MSSQLIQLTRTGLSILKEELIKIEQDELTEAIKILEDVRSKSTDQDGNELVSARDRVDFLLDRVAELKAIISRAQLTEDIPKDTSIVNLGDRVRVKIEEIIHEYRVVSSLEANPLTGNISVESPIGKALLNSTMGQSLVIEIQDRKLGIKILEIL